MRPLLTCWLISSICFVAIFCISSFALNAASNQQIEDTLKEGEKKSQCVIYGSCQAGFIYNYLKSTYPDLYDYSYIVNFIVVEHPELFPIDKVKEADIFIYQPLKRENGIDTDYIQNSLLKEDCVCISIPSAYFTGYFPDYVRDPNNKKTISNQAPYGFFPYGHQQLINLILTNNYTVEEIIDISRQKDFILSNVILENSNISLDRLEKAEEITDVKISDFIKMNFARFKLFHSHNHPTNFLYKEYMKRFLPVLGLDAADIDKNPIFETEYHEDWTCSIIYPCVANTLQLQFSTENTTYKRKKRMPYADYIREYIKQLYPEYYR